MVIERLKSTNFLDSQKSIDFHICSSATEIHSHKDYYEFFYITKGPVKYKINDKVYVLNKNDFSFVRPSDTHGFIFGKNTVAQHVNIAVKVDYFTLLCNSLNSSLFKNISSPEIPPIIHLSEQEYDQLDFWKRTINMVINQNIDEGCSYTATLLTILLSYTIKNMTLNVDGMPEWFVKLLDNINNSIFSPISITDIYDKTCYSPPIVIKTFKKYFNQTPVQYITFLKINYAKNMLKNTDYTILYISNKICFSSLSHFNHIFKKIVGQTPTEYRQLNQ